MLDGQPLEQDEGTGFASKRQLNSRIEKIYGIVRPGFPDEFAKQEMAVSQGQQQVPVIGVAEKQVDLLAHFAAGVSASWPAGQ